MGRAVYSTGRIVIAMALSAVIPALLWSQGPGSAGLTEQDVIHQVGYVRITDGTRIAYSLWRPKAEGRYPTIFSYSGYNSSATPFAAAKAYLDSGYAFIAATTRGGGCSTG